MINPSIIHYRIDKNGIIEKATFCRKKNVLINQKSFIYDGYSFSMNVSTGPITLELNKVNGCMCWKGSDGFNYPFSALAIAEVWPEPMNGTLRDQYKVYIGYNDSIHLRKTSDTSNQIKSEVTKEYLKEITFTVPDQYYSHSILLNRVTDCGFVLDILQIEEPKKSYIQERLVMDDNYNISINSLTGDTIVFPSRTMWHPNLSVEDIGHYVRAKHPELTIFQSRLFNHNYFYIYDGKVIKLDEKQDWEIVYHLLGSPSDWRYHYFRQ